MDTQWIDRKLQAVFHVSKRYARGATFLGVFPKDKLPVYVPNDKPCLLVANTDDRNKPGEHWVAMFLNPDKNYAEYFDSFGEPPPPEIDYYLSKRARRVEVNRRQIQSIASMYCGQYVVLYCAFRAIGYDVRRFARMFTNDQGFNDMIAHHLACKMLVN